MESALRNIPMFRIPEAARMIAPVTPGLILERRQM
jgi:hypothetical protein